MSKHGSVAITRSSNGAPRYEIEIRHDELNRLQIVRGEDEALVWQRAVDRMRQWDEEWATRKAALDSRSGKYHRALIVRQGVEYAADRTREVEALWQAMSRLLDEAIEHETAPGWESLKQTAEFSLARPRKKPYPPEPTRPSVPPEPRRDDPKYAPQLHLLDRLSRDRKDRRWKEAGERFAIDYAAWQQASQLADAEMQIRARAREQVIRQIEQEHRAAVAEWEEKRMRYLNERDAHNARVDEKHAAYLRDEPGAIIEYCDVVLSSLTNPEFFPRSFVFNYEPQARLLVVDYELPQPSDLPTLLELKYQKSKNTFAEKHVSKRQAKVRYDNIAYQIVLRTVYELFRADSANVIGSVIVNAFVRPEDASASEAVRYIASLSADRTIFLETVKKGVSPASAFRRLRGITAGYPSDLKPIEPIFPAR